MPPQLYKFAPACPEDAESLAAIRVEAMRPSLEAVGRFDPERARRRFLDGFCASETMLIQIDGATAGFVVVRRRADHLYLDHLYLGAAFQGGGIGRSVIEGLQAEARVSGLPIRLMALNGSPANDFYRSCGFDIVSKDALDTHYVWTPAA